MKEIVNTSPVSIYYEKLKKQHLGNVIHSDNSLTTRSLIMTSNTLTKPPITSQSGPGPGTETTFPSPDFFSILGERIPLQFQKSNAREQFGFVPAEILVRTPFCNDFTTVGKEHSLGVWSISTTNLGLMYVISVNNKVYKLLVNQKNTGATCISAYDEATSITVFEGRHAIAQAISYKDGKVIFRNNNSEEVTLNCENESKITPELARLYPLDVLILFDKNLHNGFNRLVSADDSEDPVLFIWPLILACCIKAELHYDDGSWGGSVGWDCNCSIF
jgi:hypothetical protein